MFILSGLALLFTAGFRFGAAQVANCARNYTVQLGDTCDAISAAQNVSTYQLAEVNTNINVGCTNLVLGEVLCLGIIGQDCTDTYVVVSGDNCVAIAAAENTTYDVLLANNPNVDSTCTNIYPGEVLCVAPEDVYA
ncbi:uncharacterized protein BT62DRAFT_1011428 [Guyanagaster necrorhizus]|uniref:LysM domain-containing protein n=1 Tax=Guyanagaster necrorhizus TaxID=856835 RepID=A0A9P7VIF2_9AGAR|nr:uncharacterized protein BT62DRAFT_1011428 [Guyanagaster necrorhizus MCA 3950]KAG7441628.1 hypothetical protein BT62DRAFT_1011428 [Guyanagaster necrorhizus MCA 3950]